MKTSPLTQEEIERIAEEINLRRCKSCGLLQCQCELFEKVDGEL